MCHSVPPQLTPYLAKGAEISILDHGISGCRVRDPSPGLNANRDYFSNPVWAKGYLNHVHRDAAFRRRWLRAIRSWDGLIVVDWVAVPAISVPRSAENRPCCWGLI